jgi:DNA-binding SARP family transcriptional activator
VRFEVLGPIRVYAGGDEVPVTGRRERIVLAMLLLEAGKPVPADRLIYAIWGDAPPASARNQVQVAVSHLRRRLAGAGVSTPILFTDQDGYRALIQSDQLDLSEFRTGVSTAHHTAATGAIALARDQYRAALARWRGPAFAGVDSPPVRHAGAALDEERLHALEDCLQLELALGAAGALVTELNDLVAAYPYRERLHAALMQALYRAGRQADALAAYRRVRTQLHDELGTEPGAELQRLHRAILNGDPALTAADAVPPAQLPPDVAAFTGRAHDLAYLDKLLPDQGDEPTAVVISAVDGTAGVGKTALAVHWAHRVRDRFPDGQLYIHLRGYAAGPPLPPIEALARFLHALGVPAERVPTQVEEAAAMYRSLLADKRMLVVLDNTASADQVRPLLPAGAGCLVLVTSRDQLAGLVAHEGAHRMTLDVLAPEESLALLSSLLGADRVRTEPVAAAELAGLCAHLPLALRIAAANLRGRPHHTVAAHVRQLRDSDRLANLAVPGDEQTAVRATFDLSYGRLPEPVRRMFRLLGLVPGADVTAETAAAVAGTTADQAERLLGLLVGAHLIAEHAPGRYAFHDLLRAYAADRAERDETGSDRQDAYHRLYRHLLRSANDAQQVLYPHMLRLPAPAGDSTEAAAARAFDDHSAALGWLDAERANLVAAVTDANARGDHAAAWRLADALRGYLLMRMHLVEGLTVADAALAAAEAGQHPAARAMAHVSLAGCVWRLGRTQAAIGHLTRSLQLARTAGWRECEAGSLGNLGAVHAEEAQLDAAIDHYLRALAIHEQTGRRPGQATVLVNLAGHYLRAGRLDAAAEFANRALTVNTEIAGRDGLAHSLLVLGEVQWRSGQLDTARANADRARELYQSIGNLTGEGDALRCLADVDLLSGRPASAEELITRALRLARDIGQHRLEVDSLITLATVRLQRGDPVGAAQDFQQAVAVAGERNRYWAAEAVIGLAAAYAQDGRLDPARRCGQEAVETVRQAGFRLIEGRALTVLAQVLLADGATHRAADLAAEALAIHRETGHRLGQARSHLVLGCARSRNGDRNAAREQWRRAHAILTEIGTPEADEVAALAKRPTPALKCG